MVCHHSFLRFNLFIVVINIALFGDAVAVDENTNSDGNEQTNDNQDDTHGRALFFGLVSIAGGVFRVSIVVERLVFVIDRLVVVIDGLIVVIDRLVTVIDRLVTVIDRLVVIERVIDRLVVIERIFDVIDRLVVIEGVVGKRVSFYKKFGASAIFALSSTISFKALTVLRTITVASRDVYFFVVFVREILELPA